MNYLVDTHILLWSFIEPEKLSKKACEILLDESNDIYYSPINLIENINLITSYKLPIYHKDPFDRFLIGEAIQNDFIFISVMVPGTSMEGVQGTCIRQLCINACFRYNNRYGKTQ